MAECGARAISTPAAGPPAPVLELAPLAPSASSALPMYSPVLVQGTPPQEDVPVLSPAPHDDAPVGGATAAPPLAAPPLAATPQAAPPLATPQGRARTAVRRVLTLLRPPSAPPGARDQAALLRGQTYPTSPTGGRRPVHPLHLEIDPAYWCITRSDLSVFEREVRNLWTAGVIPDNPEAPNEFHSQGDVGPTVYQVNKHYIQPRTMAAGGMSWALMMNPKGLKCDVFVSHCWAEGVFEFCAKVLKMWPRDANHLWCCFLANPQNGDIGVLLGDNPSQSPFARALLHAKHMLVVPNLRVSVYSRLWCVFEASEAIKAGILIRMPRRPAPKTVLRDSAPLLLLLAASAALSAALCRDQPWLTEADYYANVHRPLLFVPYVLPTFALMGGRLSRYCPLSYLHVVAVALGVRLGIKTVTRPGLARELALALNAAQVLVLLGLAEFAYIIFMAKCVEREGLQLKFTTVRNGTCTSPADESAIRACIAGQEAEIDETISCLSSIGRCDAVVRANLRRGMAPARIREGVVRFGAMAGVGYWAQALVIAGGPRFLPGEAPRWQSAALYALLIADAVGCAAVLLAARRFRDNFIFASDALLVSGVVAVFGVGMLDQLVVLPHRRTTLSLLLASIFAVAVGMCVRFYRRPCSPKAEMHDLCDSAESDASCSDSEGSESQVQGAGQLVCATSHSHGRANAQRCADEPPRAVVG